MTGTNPPGPSDVDLQARRFRTAALIGIAIQLMIYVYLYVYIGRHANPLGDGMEWVAIVPATIVLGLGAIPALALCLIRRLSWLAAVLAAIGVAMNVALFLEIAREIGGHPQ
jgi:hypothetical protein